MSTLTDTQYHQMVDEILLEIEQALDELDIDLDYESFGGKLDITFPNQTKIIINKQAPLHQVWVATKFNGYHFNYQDGQWIDERFGDELWHLINDASTKQAGEPVSLKRQDS